MSFVEEATEHDVGMVRSQQNVILLLEAIVSRLEKLESANDAREHGHEKGNMQLFLARQKAGKGAHTISEMFQMLPRRPLCKGVCL